MGICVAGVNLFCFVGVVSTIKSINCTILTIPKDIRNRCYICKLEIDIFDFDFTGGTLSNFMTLTGITYDIGPYGLEFSSDSSKFYVFCPE